MSLVTSRLPRRAQLWAEVIALAIATVLVGCACYFILGLIYESWQFNDQSNGIIPIPLWMPQCFMAIGMILLWIAVIDSLIGTIRTGAPVITHTEEA